jgi:hypothetical protein
MNSLDKYITKLLEDDFAERLNKAVNTEDKEESVLINVFGSHGIGLRVRFKEVAKPHEANNIHNLFGDYREVTFRNLMSNYDNKYLPIRQARILWESLYDQGWKPS